MKTNKPNASTLEKTAKNLNDMLYAISKQQKQKTANGDVNCKELSDLAKTLMQAIEISKAMDLTEGEERTLQIIMDREDYTL